MLAVMPLIFAAHSAASTNHRGTSRATDRGRLVGMLRLCDFACDDDAALVVVDFIADHLCRRCYLVDFGGTRLLLLFSRQSRHLLVDPGDLGRKAVPLLGRHCTVAFSSFHVILAGAVL